MSNIGLFMSYAVMAIFAQNLVLTGGIGASRLIRAARRPKELLSYSLTVGVFTLLSSLITYPLSLPFRGTQAETYLCPLIFTIGVSAVYFAARFALIRFFGCLFEKIGQNLNHCAFNGIVFGVPFVATNSGFGFFQTVGFAFGSAIGFMVAAFLVSEGLRRIDNAEIPRAYRGVPTALLYLGVLSLAFSCL